MPPGPGQSRAPSTSQQTAPATGTQSGPSTSTATSSSRAPALASNSDRAGQLASAIPTAELSLDSIASTSIGPIDTGAAVITGSLKLGGKLTAKPAGSTNPVTVSSGGAEVSGTATGPGGTSVEGSASSSGDMSAKLSSTLNGITSSTELKLGDPPSVTFGAAGEFGSVKTTLSGNTVTYTCTSKAIQKTINGVEVSGTLSYTLSLTITPKPQNAPWYVRAWDAVTEALSDFANWLADHKTEILVGTVVAVVVVGAVVLTGGAAAPALAPALAS